MLINGGLECKVAMHTICIGRKFGRHVISKSTGRQGRLVSLLDYAQYKNEPCPEVFTNLALKPGAPTPSSEGASYDSQGQSAQRVAPGK